MPENEGHLINRRSKEFAAEDIEKVIGAYRAWRAGEGYEDVKGFCASVPLSRVRELDYVLTPGRYVGLPDEENDFDFAERFTALKAEFASQLEEGGPSQRSHPRKSRQNKNGWDRFQ